MQSQPEPPSAPEEFRRFVLDLKQAQVVNGGALEFLAKRLKARIDLATEKELVSGNLAFAAKILARSASENESSIDIRSPRQRLRETLRRHLDDVLTNRARHILMAKTNVGWRAIAVCSENKAVSRVDAVKYLEAYEREFTVEHHDLLGGRAIRTADGEWVRHSKTSIVDESFAVEALWSKSTLLSAQEVISKLQEQVARIQLQIHHSEDQHHTRSYSPRL